MYIALRARSCVVAHVNVLIRLSRDHGELWLVSMSQSLELFISGELACVDDPIWLGEVVNCDELAHVDDSSDRVEL